jgi:hypothetical protein
MAECSYCTDPKGDMICEKCADEIYDRDEPGDEDAWKFGVSIVALAFGVGLALGCFWGRAVALAAF